MRKSSRKQIIKANVEGALLALFTGTIIFLIVIDVNGSWNVGLPGTTAIILMLTAMWGYVASLSCIGNDG